MKKKSGVWLFVLFPLCEARSPHPPYLLKSIPFPTSLRDMRREGWAVGFVSGGSVTPLKVSAQWSSSLWLVA